MAGSTWLARTGPQVPITDTCEPSGCRSLDARAQVTSVNQSETQADLLAKAQSWQFILIFAASPPPPSLPTQTVLNVWKHTASLSVKIFHYVYKHFIEVLKVRHATSHIRFIIYKLYVAQYKL